MKNKFNQIVLFVILIAGTIIISTFLKIKAYIYLEKIFQYNYVYNYNNTFKSNIKLYTVDNLYGFSNIDMNVKIISNKMLYQYILLDNSIIYCGSNYLHVDEFHNLLNCYSISINQESGELENIKANHLYQYLQVLGNPNEAGYVKYTNNNKVKDVYQIDYYISISNSLRFVVEPRSSKIIKAQFIRNFEY